MYEVKIQRVSLSLSASRNLDISGYCVRKTKKNQRQYVRYLYTIKSERTLSEKSKTD